MPCYARARKKRFTSTFEPRACFLYACSENYWMMNIYRYATRVILTLFFFTITIISTVSGEVIHFRSNMEYVPDEVSQRGYISDEDLLKVVEDIEQQQSGGGAGGSGEESGEGFFNFKRVPFREKTAKS